MSQMSNLEVLNQKLNGAITFLVYLVKENHDLVQNLMREVEDEKYPDSLNAAH